MDTERRLPIHRGHFLREENLISRADAPPRGACALWQLERHLGRRESWLALFFLFLIWGEREKRRERVGVGLGFLRLSAWDVHCCVGRGGVPRAWRRVGWVSTSVGFFLFGRFSDSSSFDTLNIKGP